MEGRSDVEEAKKRKWGSSSATAASSSSMEGRSDTTEAKKRKSVSSSSSSAMDMAEAEKRKWMEGRSYMAETKKRTWVSSTSSSPSPPSSSSSSSSDSDTEPVQSLRRSEDLGDNLLPGIPNDITLDLIIPKCKMSWKDLQTLSLVSYGWQKALRSSLVYDARARACSTETFYAIMLCKHVGKADYERVNTIALYSMRDRSWKELPPIPKVRTGIRNWSMCVSMKNNLYVLGGGHMGTHYSGSSKVYVLNLAGERSWKRCANMLQPRLRFGCGVKDGKIYVYGGISLGKFVCGCEVYDPKFDAWSRIKPMKHFRLDSRVTIYGEELVVHSGGLFEEKIQDISGNQPVDEKQEAVLLEMYDPRKDEWKSISVKPFIDSNVFFVKGHAYTMTSFGIYRYRSDKKSWRRFQPHAFAKYGIKDSRRFKCIVCPAGNELLATIGWDGEYRPSGLLLVQSKGFGLYDREIIWEEVPCLASGPHLGLRPPLICSIQL